MNEQHHAARALADALDDLERILVSKKMEDPKFRATAGDIVAIAGCSRPAAHRWIVVLRKRGVLRVSEKIREGARGPRSVSYEILLKRRG